jgi:Tfp pilus assembly protein PilF
MTNPVKVRQIIGVIAALFVAATTAAAKDIDERKWILMESGNFSVYSSLNEKKTEKLLLHLEALRAVFAAQLDDTSKLEEKPVRILVLGKLSDYETLELPENSAGAFMRDLRENYVVIANSSSMSESQTILHEYVHMIVRATQRFPYPKWWDEGYAEYVSGSELSKKFFSFGLAQRGRLNDLNNARWLPWEDILSTTSFSDFGARKTAMFYAQSWLLVHYLFNRGEDPESVSLSWANYLHELKIGSSAITAFERSFGIRLTDLRNRTKGYARNGRYEFTKVPTEFLIPDFEPSTTRVSRHDIQLQLGHLALRNDDASTAESWFVKALATDADSALGILGWANALALKNLHDEARVQFDLALSMEPENSIILTDYAKFEMQRATVPEAWFTRVDRLNAAEKLLVKARSINGSTVEIDTYLAFIWINQDSGSLRALKLLQEVIDRSPSEQWPMMLLAEGLYLEGNFEVALSLAQSVVRYEHGQSGYSRSALRLIQRIQGNDETAETLRPEIAAPQPPSRD